jgi:hypothetical protein
MYSGEGGRTRRSSFIAPDRRRRRLPVRQRNIRRGGSAGRRRSREGSRPGKLPAIRWRARQSADPVILGGGFGGLHAPPDPVAVLEMTTNGTADDHGNGGHTRGIDRPVCGATLESGAPECLGAAHARFSYSDTSGTHACFWRHHAGPRSSHDAPRAAMGSGPKAHHQCTPS